MFWRKSIRARAVGFILATFLLSSAEAQKGASVGASKIGSNKVASTEKFENPYLENKTVQDLCASNPTEADGICLDCLNPKPASSDPLAPLKEVTVRSSELSFFNLVRNQIKEWKNVPKAKTKKESDQIKVYEKLILGEGASFLDDPRYCHLTPAEYFALTYYTDKGYESLNKALRGSTEEELKYRSFSDILKSALRKLKPFQGMVWRGVEMTPQQAAQFEVGKTIQSEAFTSTSKQDGFKGHYQFEIKSKTGRYIAPYSKFPNEEEVLFPAGTKFKVLKIWDFSESGDQHIVMEEVD